jgi:hypothetical protein
MGQISVQLLMKLYCDVFITVMGLREVCVFGDSSC